MSQMSCSAFLQSHARSLTAGRTAGSALYPGIRIGLWRVDSERSPGRTSGTYRVILDRGVERATLTVFDTPALQLGSYPRQILAIAQMLKAVDHPGVVSILNAGLLADGRPYVVTDIEAGVTLPQIVPEGTRLHPSRAITILRGICAPLIAAHDIGIVHGTVALEHVFLVEGDDHYVKLLDWGIEHAVFAEARRAGIECPARVTCAAPEEALGLRSPQTDAYALGVLAHRLVFGCAPSETRCDSYEPPIPASLEALVSQLLDPDPRSRPTIREANEWLAAMSRAPSIAIDEEAAYDEMEVAPQRSRTLRWSLGIAACVSALAAVLALGLRTSHVLRTPDVAMAQTTTEEPAFEPLVVERQQQPRPIVREETPVVRAEVVRAEPVRARTVPRPAPAADLARNELLTDYQRIGRALFELRQKRGAAATSELWQQFRAFKLEPALATAQSRKDAEVTLRELREKLERQKGVEIADACLNNPLADGCR